MDVHSALQGDWFTNLQENVTYLLENGVHLLVYSGDKDFICNWRGGEKWTHEAQWSHGDDFRKAKYTDWTNDGGDKKWGEYKSVDKLTFLRVYNAGHMVPMNQPEAALAMLNKWLGGWNNSTKTEPIEVTLDTEISPVKEMLS